MINKGKYFVNRQEKWDAKKCAKMAKGRPTDGLGTPFPQGYIGSHYGRVRYNGGCCRPRPDGDWWEGEEFPLPKIAKGYRLEQRVSWGWFIVKK